MMMNILRKLKRHILSVVSDAYRPIRIMISAINCFELLIIVLIMVTL
jgi:hypothetical protein